MKHAMDVIMDMQWLALGIIVSVAVVARTAVFCYWWVSGAWDDERCQRTGGHSYGVVEKPTASKPDGG